MIRSFTRWAALVCTAAALALTSAGALAQASITLSDSNCSDFALGGTPGNRTLTCLVSSPPVCTVTGPTTGTINNPITLTASCSPASTSWAWTGGGCTTGQICTDTQTVTGTVNYRVTGTNGAGTGPQSAAYPVVWSSTPPPLPSGCSITQSPTGTLPVGGGNVTLTANCTGGTGISWSWTGGFAQGLTTAVVGPGSVTSTTAFTATATNGGGVVPTNYTVQVATGGGGGISCAAQGYASTRVIDMPYLNNALANSIDYGSFGNADAIVIRFTTDGTTSTGKGQLDAYEYSNGPTSPRMGALSDQACDFSVGLPTYQSSGGRSAFIIATGPTVYFAVNANIKNAARLLPNTTYYLNIINMPGVCGGDCAMQFNLRKATP